MKKADTIEIKKMEIKELVARLKKERSEMQSKVLEKSMGKLKNIKEINNKRKNIARILTALWQKEMIKNMEVKNDQTS